MQIRGKMDWDRSKKGAEGVEMRRRGDDSWEALKLLSQKAEPGDEAKACNFEILAVLQLARVDKMSARMSLPPLRKSTEMFFAMCLKSHAA